MDDRPASSLSVIIDLLPSAGAVAFTALAVWLVREILNRRAAATGVDNRLALQVTVIGLSVLGLVLLIVSLPIRDSIRGQLLTLLGLVITAVVTLSSTTLVAQAMAGIMLRSVGTFRIGDFIRIGEQFGRVTERGLFHTEIQTEDRDLTTLPNLYLASHPLTVVRTSGTIVSCELSIGYDVHHSRVESLLVAGAKAAGLEDAFVQVRELGNFAVTYRVAGFLPDVKTLLSVRSRLRTSVLDALHGGEVEIMSPTIMNQRPVPAGGRFIPEVPAVRAKAKPAASPAPEEMIFDKADEAEDREMLRKEREQLLETLKDLQEGIQKLEEEERQQREREIERLKARVERLATILDADESGKDKPAAGA